MTGDGLVRGVELIRLAVFLSLEPLRPASRFAGNRRRELSASMQRDEDRKAEAQHNDRNQEVNVGQDRLRLVCRNHPRLIRSGLLKRLGVASSSIAGISCR
jgi:hypothetical protein